MATGNPTISGTAPEAGHASVELRPTVYVYFAGPSLIDQRSWGPETFAIYGPGDYTNDTGPGTILNSGLNDYPYPLLDGPLKRTVVSGEYSLYVSGYSEASGLLLASGLIGTSHITVGKFRPLAPLNADTQYTAVLLGDDSATLVDADRKFPGITSYTSQSTFETSAVSGQVNVLESYSKTLPTVLYDSNTGYNDTYTIEITSGTGVAGAHLFRWKQSSINTWYLGEHLPNYIHTLPDDLSVEFTGTFYQGDIFTLDVYIPKPLEVTYVWNFTTGDIETYSTPPVTPVPPSLIIDSTGGSITVVDSDPDTLEVVSVWPPHLDYDVMSNLPYILIGFNKPLASGSYGEDNISLTATPLLGIPAVSGAAPVVIQRLEVSGYYLKVIL